MIRIEFSIGLQYDVLAPAHFVFNFAAAQTAAQYIVREHFSVNGSLPPSAVFDEPHFGNRVLRLQAAPGPLHVVYRATVDLRHTLMPPSQVRESALAELPAETLPFLLASRYCQSDQLTQLAHGEFGHLPRDYARAAAVCDWVRRRTRFMLGASAVGTTALDTLKEQRGVCRDFAHLMIALCRALNIPARFVTGLDYGADPALGPHDFHAYVEVWLGDRWYLFDPAGITVPAGLVRLATGRDAADVSFCTMFGAVRPHLPQVTVGAVQDAPRGIVLPERTDLAISTAGPGEPARKPAPQPQVPARAPRKPALQYA